ncbi:MAG: D-aminoacyl-tRNA deacylase [Putridiphycobacter sp.]
MRVVIQRVSAAHVEVNQKIIGEINQGYLILLGIENEDSEQDVEWLAQKIINLRLFADENGKMNLSINEVQGEILLVSQFTLFAKTKKGNRPSFIKSAAPAVAIPLYEKMISKLGDLLENKITTGEFGADMKVNLENDGPVTIIIDTKEKE